jgi:hypothetical protein
MKGDAIMEKYTTEELKAAWLELVTAEAYICNALWCDVNVELAKRLGKDEYAEFTGPTMGIIRARVNELLS